MTTPAKRFLSPEDKKRLIQAVKEVESTTSAEVAPMIVSASFDYPRAELAAALVVGLLVALPLDLLIFRSLLWPFLGLFGFFFLLTWLVIGRLPGLKKLFIGHDEMLAQVQEAAANAFYRLELNTTRDGTGILIYVSLFEKMVWILADKGINDKVDPGAWLELVSMITGGIRSGQSGDVLCRAVKRAGEITAKHLPVRPDDTDELANLIIDWEVEEEEPG